MRINDTAQTRQKKATETQNLCTNVHTHTYAHVYACMRISIHIVTHAYIYIYACSYTHIHTHIYTHTYNMYMCTHVSTPGTTALQRLREKPDLTPRKLRTSPLEVVVPPLSTRSGCRETIGQHRTTTTDSSSSHHHDSAPPRQQPLICTGAKPIHPDHGPPKLAMESWSQCSEIEFTFSPFSRVFLVFGLDFFTWLSKDVHLKGFRIVSPLVQWFCIKKSSICQASPCSLLLFC